MYVRVDIISNMRGLMRIQEDLPCRKVVPRVQIPPLSGNEQHELARLCYANPWYIRKALKEKGLTWLHGHAFLSKLPRPILSWDSLLQMIALGDFVELDKSQIDFREPGYPFAAH